MTDSQSIHTSTNDPTLFLLMAESYSIVYAHHSFLIHSSAVSGHLGFCYNLGYYKQCCSERQGTYVILNFDLSRVYVLLWDCWVPLWKSNWNSRNNIPPDCSVLCECQLYVCIWHSMVFSGIDPGARHSGFTSCQEHWQAVAPLCFMPISKTTGSPSCDGCIGGTAES